MTEDIYHTYFRDLFFFEFLTLHGVNSAEKNGDDRFKCRKGWKQIIFAKRMRKYFNAECICIKGLCASGW